MDEAGSRVHITSIVVPEEVAQLEKDLEGVRQQKMEVVRRQRYEEAAKLRDDEKNLEAELSKAPSPLGGRTS